MGELDGPELLTVLIAVAVLAAGRLLVHAVRRQAQPAAPKPADEDGEMTQEMPLVDELWIDFYATLPRRRARRWSGLNRRPQ